MLARSPLKRRAIAVGFVAALSLSACGGGTFSSPEGSATEVGEQFIESLVFAQRLGLDQLTDAACVEPPTEEVGEQFVCTARSSGEAVLVNVLIDDDESLFAEPINVVPGDIVQAFASDAVQQLNEDNGFDFPASALDCGTRSVVLDDRRELSCVLTDPESGTQFATSLQVNPQNASFTVEVGEPIG